MDDTIYIVGCRPVESYRLLTVMDKRQEAFMKAEDSATATHSSEPEGLACKTLEEIDEPIDPRLDPLSRPSSDELDLTLTRQLSDLVQSTVSRRQSSDSTAKEKLEEPIYVSSLCLSYFLSYVLTGSG